MPIVGLIIGLLFPRIMLVIVYLTTDWFAGIFDGLVWPILGLLFMPITLLWYLVVHNYFGGSWETIPILGMVVAVSMDLGLWKSSKK